MSHVELPRALEAYFAHAELDAVADGRRFTITLPYFDGERLDRLQWWWSLSNAQLRVGGAEGIELARRTATQRFRQHIEYWLANNRLSLGGDEPIPRLRSLEAVPPAPLDLPVPLVRSG